ncbi:lamin tail domain-containing protein [Actinopolymorpha singaporensis]|uniref:Lamin Tail Domain n=1 Tax=Actinopolymorpha singaporensis TaxID=117157 RepID=A0A1H1WCW7_9ACTN|nr:lamin tail domain-containing protein [Actinopolymorpha singaporensis]SDS94963.1 Lamin Tail Domain [Actinopolymorpha singaporensis]
MRLRSTVAACAAALSVAMTGVAVLSAPGPFVGSAEAGTVIRFGRIQYDSPGTDDRSNKSLNAEYVVVRNIGTTSVNLRGWTVRDAQRHVYTFGSFTLQRGSSVTLHTGRGTDTASHRYWGSRAYIWNNTGDTATLRSNSGATQDTCRWGGGGSGATNC